MLQKFHDLLRRTGAQVRDHRGAGSPALRCHLGDGPAHQVLAPDDELADVEVVRKVGPKNFHPQPKVDSAIVLIRPNAAKRAKVGDVTRFRVFLRDLYVHRRKNLRQALVGWPTGAREKKDVDAKLAELGIDGTVRSEALDLEQHLRLAAAFG